MDTHQSIYHTCHSHTNCCIQCCSINHRSLYRHIGSMFRSDDNQDRCTLLNTAADTEIHMILLHRHNMTPCRYHIRHYSHWGSSGYTVDRKTPSDMTCKLPCQNTRCTVTGMSIVRHTVRSRYHMVRYSCRSRNTLDCIYQQDTLNTECHRYRLDKLSCTYFHNVHHNILHYTHTNHQQRSMCYQHTL